MLKILLGILMATVCLGVSFKICSRGKDIKSIYFNLERAAGLKNIPLRIMRSNVVDAWTDGYSINITLGMLKYLGSSKDALAAVLGHELAHIKFKDYKALESYNAEYRADLQGMLLTSKIGFNRCKASKFLLKLNKLNKGGRGTGHPKTLDRYKILHRGC